MTLWHILDAESDEPLDSIESDDFDEVETEAHKRFGKNVIVVDDEFHQLTVRMKKGMKNESVNSS